MPKDIQANEDKSQGGTRGRKMTVACYVIKAIVILTSAALALKQVSILVEEYFSFPTNTLHVIKTLDEVRSPAFTICPRPSVPPHTARFQNLTLFLDPNVANESTIVEDFKNASSSFSEIVVYAIMLEVDPIDGSTKNGETIRQFDRGTWEERTFSHESRPDINFGYFNCFTLLLNEDMPAGRTSCDENVFIFDFNSMGKTEPNQLPHRIEVFVHDQREKFSTLDFFSSMRVSVLDGTVTSIFIRPEVIEQLSKKGEPCTFDQDYSYTRVPDALQKMLGDCPCPKRCNSTDYHIFGDPTPTCQLETWEPEEDFAALFVNFPSKRVPYILEKEKVTLTDLLSNIGGIVGVCLGISLISVFDVIEHLCSSIRRKLFPLKIRPQTMLTTNSHGDCLAKATY